MPTFYIQQFGCRATQADGAAIERQLLDRGCTPAGSATSADVVVLNTCTVPPPPTPRLATPSVSFMPTTQLPGSSSPAATPSAPLKTSPPSPASPTSWATPTNHKSLYWCPLPLRTTGKRAIICTFRQPPPVSSPPQVLPLPSSPATFSTSVTSSWLLSSAANPTTPAPLSKYRTAATTAAPSASSPSSVAKAAASLPRRS